MTEDEMKSAFKRWMSRWLTIVIISVVGAYLYRWKPYVGLGYAIYVLKDLHEK